MKKIKTLALSVASLVVLTGQLATAATLSGVVKAFDSEMPLSGARVRIESLGLSGVTDDSGRFAISGLDSGEYLVKVYYIGLGSTLETVSVSETSSDLIEFLIGEEVIELDPLVVEGQKLGQAKALNLQRSASVLKNLVAADAFGNFPDENAAEALQRVSGVSIEHDQGEGRYVVIRGVDPDLNLVSVDGVALPSPEGDTRKVALDVIPTEILERLEVSKTYTADMDGGSIGGNVNLKTVSVFDKGGKFGSVKGQLLYNDLVGKASYALSAAYGDLLGADGRTGVMVAASVQERDFGSNNIEVGDPWYEEKDGVGTERYFAPEIEYREYIVTRERQSVSANIEHMLGDNSQLYLRTSYSYFSDQEFRSRTEVKFESGAEEKDDNQNSVNLTHTEVGATVLNVEDTDRDLKDRFEEQEIYTVALGGETLANDWRISYQASISHAEENEPDRLDTDFRNGDTSDVSYDFSNSTQPVVTVEGGSDLFDASNFELDEAVVENNVSEDDKVAFKVDFRRDLFLGNAPSFVKFGTKFSQREKSVDNDAKAYSPDSFEMTLADVAEYSSDYPYFTDEDGYLRADADELRTIIKAEIASGGLEFEEDDYAESFKLDDYVTEEDILAVYGMLETQVGEWTLNGGLRYEQTETDTQGFGAVFIEDIEDPGEEIFSEFEELEKTNKYSDLLVSLNARYEIDENSIIRTSFSNTISRPKFGDFAFRREIHRVDEEIEGGNPDLDPYESTNFDISYERYIEPLGQWSISLFYKEIDSFIYTSLSEIKDESSSEFGYELITPQNGESASVRGLEINWQQDLGSYADFLKGFGIYANVTFADSESEGYLEREDETLPFLKQSDIISNLSLSYENEKMLFRLSSTYRDEYLDEIGENVDEDRYIASHFQIDAKAVYKINSNMSVFLDAINLTDEPLEAYYGDKSRLSQYESYSWSAKLGFKWTH
ncbi:TonB-dependent receptor [Puniceicoccaceae bacterium K14]|nr:TonB-dependent receptor [Puniceicoccaceae bacterium K14]